MANLVSNEYYTGTWMGTAASSGDELTKMLSRAEDYIRAEATKNIYLKSDSEDLKKAICSQAEYMIRGGANIEYKGVIKSESLGEYSYTVQDGTNVIKNKNNVCSGAIKYLRLAGLYSAIIC